MKGLCVLVATSLLYVTPALAQHTWTVNSGTAHVGWSENQMVTGSPWDSDGIDACPPGGADDVRCAWHQFTGGDPDEENNGVLGFVLSGPAQSAVATSDVWSDNVNGATQWWVNYNVYFVAENAAEIPNLRLTSRFKFGATTELTLLLIGNAGPNRVQFRVAPLHTWADTPETGAQWTLELTATRTAAGGPAMIWVDDIHATENSIVLFDETFPLDAASVPGEGALASAGALHVVPNPSSGAIKIQLAGVGNETVPVQVFDMTGRKIRSLLFSPNQAGPMTAVWDGLDASGRSVPAGAYVVRAFYGSQWVNANVLRVR